MAELEGLKQTTSVKEYYDEFVRVINRMQLSSDYKLYCFIAGLKEEIRCNVSMFNPKTLHDAYCLAKLQEFTLKAQNTLNTKSLQLVNRLTKPWNLNPKNYLHFHATCY